MFGRCFLVLFRESVQRRLHGERDATNPSEISHVEQLEQELQATLSYLHAIIEEQEATNEELKSANEEILSSNEELHSLNEELESAKEELQSVNEELERRNAELGKANNDLSNLLSNMNIPMLMLDADLRIRRFTPAVERLLEVTAADIGAPIAAIRPKIAIDSLAVIAGEVIETMGQSDHEVQDHTGRSYWMRVRPYRSPENKLEGAVITWIDIDAIRRGERELRESRDRLLATLEALDRPLLVFDGELRVRFANRAYYETFRAYPGETEDKLLSDLGDGVWDLPGLDALLREEVLRDSKRLSGRQVEIDLAHVGRRTYSLSASRLRRERGAPPALLLALEDVTERVASERTLRAQAASSRALLQRARDRRLSRRRRRAQ
jgi:two-component system CheB/CheR fusion protein